MFSFIKACEFRDVRKKLIIIYALNVTDILFTLFLLSTKMFIEVNPIMVFLIENSYLSLIARFLFPAVLIFYMGLRLSKATSEQLRKSNIVISVLFIAYALMNILHLVWIVIYLFYIL